MMWSELGGAVWHGSLVGSLDSSAWLAMARRGSLVA